PLPAAAQLHRAGSRARAVGRPHHQGRRQGTGARARGEGLCADHQGCRMTALVLPNRRVEDWKYSDLRNAIDPAAVDAAPTALWRVSVSGAMEQNDFPEIMPYGRHGAMAEIAAAH